MNKPYVNPLAAREPELPRGRVADGAPVHSQAEEGEALAHLIFEGHLDRGGFELETDAGCGGGEEGSLGWRSILESRERLVAEGLVSRPFGLRARLWSSSCAACIRRDPAPT